MLYHLLRVLCLVLLLFFFCYNYLNNEYLALALVNRVMLRFRRNLVISKGAWKEKLYNYTHIEMNLWLSLCLNRMCGYLFCFCVLVSSNGTFSWLLVKMKKYLHNCRLFASKCLILISLWILRAQAHRVLTVYRYCEYSLNSFVKLRYIYKYIFTYQHEASPCDFLMMAW